MKNADFYIHALNCNANTFKTILNEVPDEQLHWKQAEEKWSLLDIICHLYDEEREDFRARIRSVLDDPSKPFPKIDPQAWVKERNYAGKNFKNMVAAFMSERNNSIKWLYSLKEPKWDNAFQHPTAGPVSARFILTNWVAHDYLHVRQIIKLKYDYLQYISNESLDYAGKW